MEFRGESTWGCVVLRPNRVPLLTEEGLQLFRVWFEDFGGTGVTGIEGLLNVVLLELLLLVTGCSASLRICDLVLGKAFGSRICVADRLPFLVVLGGIGAIDRWYMKV